MDEQSFNDDVTMGGPLHGKPTQNAADSERSMNDDVTIVDRPGGSRSAFDGGTMNNDKTLVDLPGQNPAGQKSKEFDEPVLAEIDQFALIKKLGEGAAGKVYMAYDRETKLKVAVKGLPISMSAMTREAIKGNFRTVVNLNHPNIASAREYHVIRTAFYNDGVTAEDFKMQVGDALLVMEYAEGKTLAAWRREQSAIDQRTILEIVRQIAGALDEAHRQEIIHRDVKPANININIRPNGEPEVKLLDFGIAAEGMGEGVAGTRTYMAPEQASGGKYVPLATARTVDTTLGAIYRNFLRGVAVKEQNEEDDRLAERYLWFIVTALVLLIAGASLSRGRPRSRRLAARRGAAA